jgi:hypothetical protein
LNPFDAQAARDLGSQPLELGVWLAGTEARFDDHHAAG